MFGLAAVMLTAAGRALRSGPVDGADGHGRGGCRQLTCKLVRPHHPLPAPAVSVCETPICGAFTLSYTQESLETVVSGAGVVSGRAAERRGADRRADSGPFSWSDRAFSKHSVWIEPRLLAFTHAFTSTGPEPQCNPMCAALKRDWDPGSNIHLVHVAGCTEGPNSSEVGPTGVSRDHFCIRNSRNMARACVRKKKRGGSNSRTGFRYVG